MANEVKNFVSFSNFYSSTLGYEQDYGSVKKCYCFQFSNYVHYIPSCITIKKKKKRCLHAFISWFSVCGIAEFPYIPVIVISLIIGNDCNSLIARNKLKGIMVI